MSCHLIPGSSDSLKAKQRRLIFNISNIKPVERPYRYDLDCRFYSNRSPGAERARISDGRDLNPKKLRA
jgi:hypothetical protein